MKNLATSEEWISSKKDQMVAIAQLFGVLAIAPVMIAISWYF
jgi:hypothetical protein